MCFHVLLVTWLKLQNYGCSQERDFDYFTCCFRFIVGWPLAVRKPQGRHNSRRKVSKHPRVSMTKDIDLCRTPDFSLVKTDRERGQDGQIRRTRSSSTATETRNCFIITTSSWLVKMSSLLKHGTEQPVNTAWLRTGPPDSQQIPDRLTPPEQWDKSGDGFRRGPGCPSATLFSRLHRNFPSTPPGEGETTNKSKRRKNKTTGGGPFSSFEFQVLIFIIKNFHFPYANRVRPTTPDDLSYLQSGWVDFQVKGSHLWLTAEGKAAAHYDFPGVEAVFFPALCGEELWFLFAESTSE